MHMQQVPIPVSLTAIRHSCITAVPTLSSGPAPMWHGSRALRGMLVLQMNFCEEPHDLISDSPWCCATASSCA